MTTSLDHDVERMLENETCQQSEGCHEGNDESDDLRVLQLSRSASESASLARLRGSDTTLAAN